MKEDFLHYLWKFQKFSKTKVTTTQNEPIEILSPGVHNYNSGPDFLNARIKIGSQLWAGNVEIHLKSSDWYAHRHETDPVYDAVILHVVWQHDIEVYMSDNVTLPTLVLKERIEKTLLESYQKLFSKKKRWINCENQFHETEPVLLQNWLERLYFERLETKSEVVFQHLQNTHYHWEAVLFRMLAKNFGLKVNGDAFLSLVTSFDFKILQKIQNDLSDLESLFFGQAGLLDDEVEDAHYKQLQFRYVFLKNKFGLENKHVIPLQFFRLRPVNFPTIRLAQLAALYHQHQSLFNNIIQVQTRDEIHRLFEVQVSAFWDNHYHFKSVSPKKAKRLSSGFIDLIIINTIAVIKFCYAQTLGKDVTDEITALVSAIQKENNHIVQGFSELYPLFENGLQSQALLQLKNEYCDKNRCLQCVVGNSILQRN